MYTRLFQTVEFRIVDLFLYIDSRVLNSPKEFTEMNVRDVHVAPRSSTSAFMFPKKEFNDIYKNMYPQLMSEKRFSKFTASNVLHTSEMVHDTNTYWMHER